ncbi:MAG: B12-binding domain-containing protein [Opitutales bacterium]
MKDIVNAVIAGKIDEIKALVEQALSEGFTPEDISLQGLVVGMDAVGERWKNDEMFMPEVLRSAKAMSGGMDLIRDQLADTESQAGTMVLGTVEGDLHDIGKDLAGMMFEGSGYKVVNLGVDQPSEVFIEAVKEHKPQLLGISALLTTTMPRMGEIINELKEAGIRDNVAVIIGGAPVTDDFAQSIGADIYAPNARSGVERAREYFQSKTA